MKVHKFVMLTAVAVLFAFTASSCMSLFYKPKKTNLEISLTPYTGSVPETFNDINNTVKLNVNSTASNATVVNMENASKFIKETVSFTVVPSIKEFATEATTAFMQMMRFDISNNSEYRLNIDVKTFTLEWISEDKTRATVRLQYKLVDADGATIIPAKEVSAINDLPNAMDIGIGLGRAYNQALRKIQWSEIADELTVKDSPKKKPAKRCPGRATRHLNTV